ncbi:MAG: hypothetical protein HYS81_03390 [Candidatus Aenigmatarchaeota archaeon]|nr:MAG: hypothetical protein HYS81_03390 [Candidatus Aenigmarchaeota archaeon]
MVLDKIAAYVKEHGVTKFKYHTWRKFDNGRGEIRILVLDDGVARCEYQCAKCTNIGYVEAEWKRPFSTACAKCGAKIAVPKLRDAMKREMKKGSAEAGGEE